MSGSANVGKFALSAQTIRYLALCLRSTFAFRNNYTDKIGPVLAGNLISNGITSLEKLAETDPRLIEAVCTFCFYLCLELILNTL
jgi:hypothetical protein